MLNPTLALLLGFLSGTGQCSNAGLWNPVVGRTSWSASDVLRPTISIRAPKPARGRLRTRRSALPVAVCVFPETGKRQVMDLSHQGSVGCEAWWDRSMTGQRVFQQPA